MRELHGEEGEEAGEGSLNGAAASCTQGGRAQCAARARLTILMVPSIELQCENEIVHVFAVDVSCVTFALSIITLSKFTAVARQGVPCSLGA